MWFFCFALLFLSVEVTLKHIWCLYIYIYFSFKLSLANTEEFQWMRCIDGNDRDRKNDNKLISYLKYESQEYLFVHLTLMTEKSHFCDFHIQYLINLAPQTLYNYNSVSQNFECVEYSIASVALSANRNDIWNGIVSNSFWWVLLYWLHFHDGVVENATVWTAAFRLMSIIHTQTSTATENWM